MSLEERMEKENSKRLNVFKSKDAEKYAVLCNEQGVEPEDLDLYERGVLEINLREQRKTELAALNEKRPYENFLRMYRGLGLDRNLNRGYVSKIRVLVANFPKRFGENGIQPIYDYPPEKVGALCNEMVDYSKERLGE
jgi:hypothetical protein